MADEPRRSGRARRAPTGSSSGDFADPGAVERDVRAAAAAANRVLSLGSATPLNGSSDVKGRFSKIINLDHARLMTATISNLLEGDISFCFLHD